MIFEDLKIGDEFFWDGSADLCTKVSDKVYQYKDTRGKLKTLDVDVTGGFSCRVYLFSTLKESKMTFDDLKIGDHFTFTRECGPGCEVCRKISHNEYSSVYRDCNRTWEICDGSTVVYPCDGPVNKKKKSIMNITIDETPMKFYKYMKDVEIGQGFDTGSGVVYLKIGPCTGVVIRATCYPLLDNHIIVESTKIEKIFNVSMNLTQVW